MNEFNDNMKNLTKRCEAIANEKANHLETLIEIEIIKHLLKSGERKPKFGNVTLYLKWPSIHKDLQDSGELNYKVDVKTRKELCRLKKELRKKSYQRILRKLLDHIRLLVRLAHQPQRATKKR